MKPISYSELCQRLPERSQNSVDRIRRDPEVHFLIVLQADSGSKPKILPAGPNLDFRTPKDAAGQIIRGMRAVAYVDLKAETARANVTGSSKPSVEATQREQERVRERDAKSVWYENENIKLYERLRKAKRILREKDIKIEELTKRNEMLNARMDEYNCSGDLATEKRIKDIENAENELIDRMNELLRKEAEIEQREEELLEREQDFSHA